MDELKDTMKMFAFCATVITLAGYWLWLDLAPMLAQCSLANLPGMPKF